MDRRSFLVAGLGISLSPLIALAKQEDGPVLSWPADLRWLWIKRVATGEEFKISYFKDGAYQREGYIQACHALRDVHEKEGLQTVQMDFHLLDLIFACQEWLRYYSIVKPVHVLSGYRSKRRNDRIEGAAQNSMHIYGKAADIYIPGISVDYLGKLSAWFQAGGVGWYANNGFIHVDTSRVRYWSKK